MGRDLQKRKRRSSRPAIRQPSSAMRSKRLLNPLGSDIVARSWNKNETTTQNYRRLGLVSRLKAPTGGVEPSKAAVAAASLRNGGRPTKPTDPFAIGGQPAVAVISEVRVERDASGRIVRVLDGKKHRANPLNDPLNALDSDDDDDDEDARGAVGQEEEEEWGGFDEEAGGIVPQLEREANRPVVKKPRSQSAQEVEWLRSLVDEHGDDTAAMARDRKLNPMQQTEADIARRIGKWKKGSSA
ncbi:Nucleolar protein 16 [Parahypoxylon ruwenzoriense]